MNKFKIGDPVVIDGVRAGVVVGTRIGAPGLYASTYCYRVEYDFQNLGRSFGPCATWFSESELSTRF